MKPLLLRAKTDDLETLCALVRQYHAFEDIQEGTAEDLKRAIAPLLGESALGRIWLITVDEEAVGYIALGFGYSIEFGGRDAFVDEFFILEAHRRKGLGRFALKAVLEEAKTLGIQALHLEVAKTNTRAKKFYQTLGFAAREKFQIMSYQHPSPQDDLQSSEPG